MQLYIVICTYGLVINEVFSSTYTDIINLPSTMIPFMSKTIAANRENSTVYANISWTPLLYAEQYMVMTDDQVYNTSQSYIVAQTSPGQLTVGVTAINRCGKVSFDNTVMVEDFDGMKNDIEIYVKFVLL